MGSEWGQVFHGSICSRDLAFGHKALPKCYRGRPDPIWSRFASYSFPSSFEPHDYHPGLLKLESRIAESVGDKLGQLGHKIEWWPEMIWLAGSIGMIDANRKTGLLSAGADPRRMAYALGR